MMEAATVRVILVDDQQLLREGFERLLELSGGAITVVGAAADGAAALATIERLVAAGTAPDVALMDVRMPRLDGVAATAALKERWPAIQVLMLTTFDDEASIVAGLRAGASGYLLKDCSVEQLVAAIHAAARGETVVPPAVAVRLVEHARRAKPAPPERDDAGLPMDELTEREREILTFLARGASNREISEALFITEGTVKNHVSNILNKLNLRDRTQAALYAHEHDLA